MHVFLFLLCDNLYFVFCILYLWLLPPSLPPKRCDVDAVCRPPPRDPTSRPSARDALGHPWLQKGNTRQRLQGAQLTQVRRGVGGDV